MERKFLDKSFQVTTWEELKPYFNELLEREINSKVELVQWFKDRSELESVVSEDLAWRYIKMTCDTENEQIRDRFNDFIQNIEPKIAPLSDALNKKVVQSEYLKDVEKQLGYDIMIREVKKEIELFREENIPLFTEMQTESQRYGQISGAMTITLDDKELTLQQAGVELQSTDREHREKVYNLISARRLTDKEKLDELFDKLIAVRDKVAKNTGFANYRDYKFKAMGRFDYTAQDCFDMHDSIQHEVVPILNQLAAKRKEQLKVDDLRPFDKAVDPEGKKPLKAFESGDDLLQKSIKAFGRIDPYFGECLQKMDKMGHLDLVSRKGKAPGGYNYPLAESGVPFIFMNATSTLRDMVTLMHEGGHAVHAFLADPLELNDFKSTPSEVAELASMSMELISMDAWDEFFSNEEDLKRAKLEHLEQLIETLPWVATIDKFQHWIYENPNQTHEERKAAWNQIFDAFTDSVTDWEGLSVNKDYLWQKQLHLYEVPFYYIEYGMAQLGAVAIWKNYKENKKKGLDGYKAALKLGYTKTIPEIYEAAQIKFDFSQEYIKELMKFVKGEMEAL
ncbi:MAG: M3 family oligoendopeptidase [Cyclobacteriaceae bacterium]|nr:M3 family oligoendopeptidase [Cyclobacteriaceae bacterium]